jgi:hypothetical protein
MSCDLASGPGRRRAAGFALLLLCALPLLGPLACGKKGDPAPPLRAVPAPIRDLVIVQRGNRLLFAFTYPKTTVAGQALPGLSRIELWEVIRPLPPAAPTPPAAPAATPPATPSAGAPPPATGTEPPADPILAGPPAETPEEAVTPAPPPVGTEPVGTEPSGTEPAGTEPPAGTAPAAPAAPAPGPGRIDMREFNAASKQILTLTGEEIAAATSGDRVLLDLPLPDPLPQPEARTYAVRTVSPTDEQSGFSNLVAISPGQAPPAPSATTVTPQAEGVLIEWTVPEGVVARGGFNVYRRGSQVRAYGPPLFTAAPGDRRYVDTSARFGEDYIYAVTSIARRAPLIESAIQSEHEVRYQDRFAPPPPRNVVALPDTGRMRVVWQASEVDVTGYLVYRREARRSGAPGSGTEDFRKLTPSPIAELEFSDTAVTPGTTYIYRVTAVDARGNESPPAEARAIAE